MQGGKLIRARGLVNLGLRHSHSSQKYLHGRLFFFPSSRFLVIEEKASFKRHSRQRERDRVFLLILQALGTCRTRSRACAPN